MDPVLIIAQWWAGGREGERSIICNEGGSIMYMYVYILYLLQIPLLKSDEKPVMVLSNLVNGTYNFTLHVTNSLGESANDSMTLHVLSNPFDHFIIQLHLDTEISNFTRADMASLFPVLCTSTLINAHSTTFAFKTLMLI